jgi:hypothetical protein
MDILRRAQHITRFVLVWFALSIGVAMASPMVNPKALDVVCSSGGGMKWVVVGDDADTASTPHTLDCPLCASVAAPPLVTSPSFAPASPLAHAVQPVTAARLAAATAPPLPSRGPPTLSC